MAYVKKYIKGKRIKNISKLYDLIFNKKQFIFHNHKPLHYGWIMCWKLVSIRTYIELGQLFHAKENKKCPK